MFSRQGTGMRTHRVRTVIALAISAASAVGAQQTPGTPAPSLPSSPGAPSSPQAAVPANPFPPANLKNFTAASPSREEVNSFLTAMWGYDPNRIWSVQAVLNTPAPGVSKVVVLVADKTKPGKVAPTVFFTTPDGKHAIADAVIDFGSKPFSATRALLQAQANGPARGATGKDLELVEFADLQCPHCKEAQSTLDSLLQDFPQARLVYESFPIAEVHPFALQAAVDGECVRQAKGDAAFFIYAQAVYDHQSSLTPTNATATLNAAVSKAGANPAAVATCATAPATREAIAAQEALGKSIGVDQTPMLAVNGHLLPLASLPYEVLKRIVAFQAGEDGLTVQVQPSLQTLR